MERTISFLTFNRILSKRCCALLLVMCVIVALSLSSAAQTGSEVRKDCQASEGDLAVRACTAVIESGFEIREVAMHICLQTMHRAESQWQARYGCEAQLLLRLHNQFAESLSLKPLEPIRITVTRLG